MPTNDSHHCVCGYRHPVASMVTGHKARCEVKMCGDCGERPAPDQRPPKPGAKKDSRCPACRRELARARKRRERDEQ